jgi:hypothetical protein
MQGRKQNNGLHCNKLSSSSFKLAKLNRIGSLSNSSVQPLIFDKVAISEGLG